MSAILIVDDNEQNRYLLRTLLTAAGHAVLEAHHGAEALELARRTHPDLIISDVLMPQMDGFTLCRECKRDETLRDIPFVFYTATYTDPRDEALGLQLGAARFIIKPVENEEFIATLREVLQAHQAGQLTAPPPPPEEEATFYRLYNETLIRKLEDKLTELEETNRALELELVERKRAEAALRESEARFSTIFRASPVAIAITRLADHQLVDVNAAWQAMTGYTRAEVVGHTPLELNLWVNPEQRQRLIETLRTQGTARDEVQVRRKSGEIGDVLMSADLIELAGERYLLSMAQDITERKQAEQKLAEQLDELRRWHTATLGREGRVLELKREVNELLRRLGEPIRYPSAEEQDPKGLEDL